MRKPYWYVASEGVLHRHDLNEPSSCEPHEFAFRNIIVFWRCWHCNVPKRNHPTTERQLSRLPATLRSALDI